MFDDQCPDDSPEDRDYRLRAALRVCQVCPERDQCAALLPRQRESGRGGAGVQAGQLLVELAPATVAG